MPARRSESDVLAATRLCTRRNPYRKLSPIGVSNRRFSSREPHPQCVQQPLRHPRWLCVSAAIRRPNARPSASWPQFEALRGEDGLRHLKPIISPSVRAMKHEPARSAAVQRERHRIHRAANRHYLAALAGASIAAQNCAGSRRSRRLLALAPANRSPCFRDAATSPAIRSRRWARSRPAIKPSTSSKVSRESGLLGRRNSGAIGDPAGLYHQQPCLAALDGGINAAHRHQHLNAIFGQILQRRRESR